MAGRAIVDVGCGGGLLAEAMARKGARVVGLDMADDVLDVAQYLAQGCQAALEIVADAAGLPSGVRGGDGALATIPAPSDIDVMVLRACGHGRYASDGGTGGTLTESIVETLDCDVLLMPPASAA